MVHPRDDRENCNYCIVKRRSYSSTREVSVYILRPVLGRIFEILCNGDNNFLQKTHNTTHKIYPPKYDMRCLRIAQYCLFKALNNKFSLKKHSERTEFHGAEYSRMRDNGIPDRFFIEPQAT